jgi:hypothetical protein
MTIATARKTATDVTITATVWPVDHPDAPDSDIALREMPPTTTTMAAPNINQSRSE